jgi:putative hydrolase of the HAD superfamily
LAFIHKLRSRIRTGVISNSWLGSRRAMAKWITSEMFDAIIFSSEEKVRKPEAAIYRVALDRLGLAPDEAMFFDDFPENVDAAGRIGIEAFIFQGAHQTIERLRKIFLSTSPL